MFLHWLPLFRCNDLGKDFSAVACDQSGFHITLREVGITQYLHLKRFELPERLERKAEKGLQWLEWLEGLFRLAKLRREASRALKGL